MNKEKKLIFFQNRLLSWYKVNARNFQWRNRPISNYQIIIAEVLLQRTKAETVSRFYPQFIKDYPSWKSLANANLADIENCLKPLGLHIQRSKRLISLAKEMVFRKGRVPKNRKDLETIPFMGQYIANAVELIIFDKHTPLLDVNMARVLERYFAKRKMADIRYDPYLQSLSRKVVNNSEPKNMNWAILDFAALVCRARNPLCHDCELNLKCSYYRTHSIPKFART